MKGALCPLRAAVAYLRSYLRHLSHAANLSFALPATLIIFLVVPFLLDPSDLVNYVKTPL